MLADAHQLGFVRVLGALSRVLSAGLQDVGGGGMAQHGAHVAVKGAGGAAALHVAQDGDAHILAQALLQNLFDIGAGDGLALPVAGPLGNDDDAVAAAALAAGLEIAAHLVFPALHVRRPFGDQDPVGARSQAAHQGQVAAVAAHDLDHKGTLVACRRAGDSVDGLGDAVQGRVRADGHIGAKHVVVDGAHQAHDAQLRMGVGRLLLDLARLHQLGQQLGPFLAKEVGPRQAAIPANDHQPVNAPIHQVARRVAPAFAGAELGTAGRADDGAALVEDATHVLPPYRADGIGTRHHAPVAVIDRIDFGAQVAGRAYHGPNSGIHAWRIPAAGQDPDGDGLTLALGLIRHPFLPLSCRSLPIVPQSGQEYQTVGPAIVFRQDAASPRPTPALLA